MRNKIFIGIIITFCVSNSRLFAQTNELDLKYTPPKSSILGKGSANDEDVNNAKAPDAPEFKYVIKLNFMQITKGIFAIEFEKPHKENTAFQLGFGLSFYRDMIQKSFVSFLGLNKPSPESDISLFATLYYSSNKFTLQPYLSAAYRFYFGPNEWHDDRNRYFEFGIKTNGYSLEIRNTAGLTQYVDHNIGYYIGGSSKTTVRVSDFNFRIGYQKVSGKKIKSTQDISFGCGISWVTFNAFYKSPEDVNGNMVDVYRLSGSRAAKAMPHLSIGYSFGLGF